MKYYITILAAVFATLALAFADSMVAAYQCQLVTVPIRNAQGEVVDYAREYDCQEIKPSPSPDRTRETR